jgi:hypothetical protein
MQLSNDLDIRLYNFYVLDKLCSWGTPGYTGTYKRRLNTKEVMRKLDFRDQYSKSLDLKLSRLNLVKSCWYSDFRSVWEKVYRITLKGIEYIEGIDPIYRSNIAIKILETNFDKDVEVIFIDRELAKVPITELPTLLTHDNWQVRHTATYFYDTKIAQV